MVTIFNEDCIETMNRIELSKSIDTIITSPPYNTSRVGDKDKYSSRYDMYQDHKSTQEYIDWTIDIFNGYDKILKPNGCICYNVSYSSENTDTIWLLIAQIITRTQFTTADCIIWKKPHAIPNNRSLNKLTRICEYIFIFCRKSEIKTFYSNKKVVSTIAKTGQKNYENIYNFIEAKNNDGSNPLNKATFSTDLVLSLLKIYTPTDGNVYDSFMGVGTTAKACDMLNINCYGSEISKDQIEYYESSVLSRKSKLIEFTTKHSTIQDNNVEQYFIF